MTDLYAALLLTHAIRASRPEASTIINQHHLRGGIDAIGQGGARRGHVRQCVLSMFREHPLIKAISGIGYENLSILPPISLLRSSGAAACELVRIEARVSTNFPSLEWLNFNIRVLARCRARWCRYVSTRNDTWHTTDTHITGAKTFSHRFVWS